MQVNPEPNFAQVSSESQDDICLLITNLDSGQKQVFDKKTSESFVSLGEETKKQTWSNYWKEQKKLADLLLKYTLERDYCSLLELMQEYPVDLTSYIYIDGWSLLHYAAIKGDALTCNLFLQKGFPINYQTATMRRTALHEATIANKTEIIDILLGYKADVNIPDADQFTPLHYAVHLGSEEVTHCLLDYSGLIDFESRNDKNMTPIDCCRSYSIMELLLTRKATQEGKDLDDLIQSPSSIHCRSFVSGHMLFFQPSHSDRVEKYLDLEPKSRLTGRPHTKPATPSKRIVGLGQKQSPASLKASRVAKKSLDFMKKWSLPSTLHQEDIFEYYDKLRMIGRGGFGEVYLVRKKRSSQVYAMKQLSKTYILEQQIENYVYSERNIMTQIEHPFIIRPVRFSQCEYFLYIIMDYCPRGDLRSFLEGKQRLSEEITRKYAAELILALEYLHKQQIIFRDLKTANVLVDQEGHLRLCDFGLAKQSITSYSFLGSFSYMAPEMLVESQQKHHTSSIDWYLLGVLIYELLVGTPPFYSLDQEKMIASIKATKPTFPKNLQISRECRQLLLLLLQKQPNRRMCDPQRIKEHQWFAGYNWDSVYKKQITMPLPELSIREEQLFKKKQQQSSCLYTPIATQYFGNWNLKVS